MEVSNNSITGIKRYTREFKRLVVEKKYDENWTWLRTVEWIEEEYDINLPTNTVMTFGAWYREEQEGRVGKSSSEGTNSAKHWRPQEDAILKECVEEGLTIKQTVDFM